MAAAATIDVSGPMASDSVFKPALLLMSGRTLAFAATFFIPLVLARTFNQAEFGTYKQLFLIWGTVYSVGQLGMVSSLYYFLPKDPGRAGGYAANSVLFVGVAGLICCGVLAAVPWKVGQWLSNGSLPAYLPWIGAYILLMMLSMALEIVLISRGRYSWAASSYAISDIVRAGVFIVPALLFRRLEYLLMGAVLLAGIRVAVTIWYFLKDFKGSFRPDWTLLRTQWAYAFPFGLAVLVEILQASLPQYVVSHLFDPATFAIFAVGCLQIPLVDFAASPTSDVMMVKMQERLTEGRRRAVVEIWHDTTWKLALVFFPLTAFLMADAREIIVFLYTRRYAASAEIFIVWSAMIVLTILQVDGVLRVFAQTRLLLVLNLMRLAIIGGLIKWALGEFHLVGAALVIVLATLMFKMAALIRMRSLFGIRWRELLPWRELGALAGAALCAALVVLAVKSGFQAAAPFPSIAIAGVVYGVTYGLLVWRFDLLNQSERQAIANWVRKAGLALSYERE